MKSPYIFTRATLIFHFKKLFHYLLKKIRQAGFITKYNYSLEKIHTEITSNVSATPHYETLVFISKSQLMAMATFSSLKIFARLFLCWKLSLSERMNRPFEFPFRLAIYNSCWIRQFGKTEVLFHLFFCLFVLFCFFSPQTYLRYSFAKRKRAMLFLVNSSEAATITLPLDFLFLLVISGSIITIISKYLKLQLLFFPP